MDAPVDMSLDDIIKSKRTIERTRGRGRAPRGRGSGRSFRGGRISGPVRRGPLAVNARPSSYAIAKPSRQARSFPWQTDLFEDSIRAAGIQGIEVGTKLYVSNLDRGVTNEDIRELFSEIGAVKRYAVHYDSSGRPSGSAEVVYTRRSDAFLAFKRYNNVLLDGKPMKIEIVGANTVNPVIPRVNVTGLNGKKRRTVVMPGQRVGGRALPMVNRGTSTGSMWVPRNSNNGRGGGAAKNSRGRGGGSRGGGRGGRGGGRGAGKKKAVGAVEKSAEQLDKELDTYHAEAMNTS